MAPSRQKIKPNLKPSFNFKNFVQKWIDYGIQLWTNPEKLGVVTVLILAVEIVINIVVIQRVKYTEIDWIAYMQECEGFLNGTLDYGLLKGDTGPLVYPAGFVYIYSLLYYVTSNGTNIRLAQYIFLGIYLLQLYLVLTLYKNTRKVPPYALIITILTSYRIHSIYMLRLFNDTIAVLFLYLSLNLFIKSKWTLGSFIYSVAVSVKMNILLFAPALFLTYLANLGALGTLKQLLICGLVQLVLGAPFLYGNWINYLKGSFDLQRVFEHKWTVNYRFLPIDIFENKIFHLALLVVHLTLIFIFMFKLRKYFTSYPTLKQIEFRAQKQIDKQNRKDKNKKDKDVMSADQKKFMSNFESMLKQQNPGAVTKEENKEYSINFSSSNQLLILPLFLANFIGMVCARSLHYQFYVWYFHSLPYLIFCTKFSKPTMFLLLALIEFSWNTYPSTDISSAMLHGCHFVILYGILRKL